MSTPTFLIILFPHLPAQHYIHNLTFHSIFSCTSGQGNLRQMLRMWDKCQKIKFWPRIFYFWKFRVLFLSFHWKQLILFYNLGEPEPYSNKYLTSMQSGLREIISSLPYLVLNYWRLLGPLSQNFGLLCFNFVSHFLNKKNCGILPQKIGCCWCDMFGGGSR